MDARHGRSLGWNFTEAEGLGQSRLIAWARRAVAWDSTSIEAPCFFFSFAFTLGFQFPLRIWWSYVGHPRVHKAHPVVLLVMSISLLTMPGGSCMSVKCGRYLALPLHVGDDMIFMTLFRCWLSVLCPVLSLNMLLWSDLVSWL